MIPFLAALLGRTKTLTDRLTATRASNLDFLDAAISTASVIRSIQYGTITTSTNTNGTVTIAAVTVAKTALVHLGVSGGGVGGDDTNIRITLTNSTTVTWDRTGTTAGTTGSFCVVEFK